MRTVIRGVIKDFAPSFNGLVDENGMLFLLEDGEFALTVDTWFSGGIALSKEILERMDVELIDFGIFRLATGDEVELPVFWGKVVVKDSEIETWFVPGDLLLGMEFLSLAGSLLCIDFGKGEVKLLRW
jgi:predicted aspartyl protease